MTAPSSDDRPSVWLRALAYIVGLRCQADVSGDDYYHRCDRDRYHFGSHASRDGAWWTDADHA